MQKAIFSLQLYNFSHFRAYLFFYNEAGAEKTLLFGEKKNVLALAAYEYEVAIRRFPIGCFTIVLLQMLSPVILFASFFFHNVGRDFHSLL